MISGMRMFLDRSHDSTMHRMKKRVKIFVKSKKYGNNNCHEYLQSVK